MSGSVMLPQINVPRERENRCKVGFYQHFRREARAFVAFVHHWAARRSSRCQIVERMQVVSL